ncbi:MAG: hypothetical protein ABUL64_00115, partial [Singulisphaera sp.]
MSKFLRNSRAAALVLATILAGGALIVWAFTAGFAGALALESWYRHNMQESLQITYEGRPVISARTLAKRNADPVYLSLDRKIIPPAELVGPQQRRRVQPGSDSLYFIRPALLCHERETAAWSELRDVIHAYVDGNNPARFWYLVRHGGSAGYAYFEGYDFRSRERIGYLVTGGFRLETPPVDEQFDIGASPLSAVATTRHGGQRGRVPHWGGNQEDARLLAALSGDQLYLIDLLVRSVSQVPLDEPVISLGM